MKYLALVFSALLFLTCNAVAGDWVDLAPATNDTILLTSNGKDTTVSINFIRRDQTFTESLYMTYVFEYYTDGKAWVPCNDTYGNNSCYKLKTPSLAVNLPYKSIGITFTPKSSVDTMGLFRVRITAANGPKSSGCVVYFRVTPYTPPSNFYVLKDLAGADRIIISYDTSLKTPLVGAYNNVTKKWDSRYEYLLGKGPTLRKIFYQVGGVGQYCFSIDKQNNFWVVGVGSDGIGTVTKYGKIYNTTYDNQNSKYKGDNYANYNSHKFVHLSDGTTFISNQNTGTYKFKDGVVTPFPEDDSLLASGRTFAMREFKDTVWISFNPPVRNPNSSLLIEPVYKCYGNTIVKLPTRLADTNELVSAGGMLIDRKGVLWCGMGIYDKYGKLKRTQLATFDGTSWVPIMNLDSINSDYKGTLRYFVFDSHGKMWILTSKKFLYEFDGKKIGRVFDSKDTPLENTEFKFMEIDSANTIYFDNRNGVTLFNPDGIPLPSIAVTAVEESEAENVTTGVYPQPARDNITFDLPAESRDNPTTIEIFSSQGMAVMQGTTFSDQLRYTMATNELASGLYFAVIHAGKSIVRKPFMVVR
ncbi:MAG: T9SS type A sorting domain-containing protein [Candidatus Kapaibacterium sp.]